MHHPSNPTLRPSRRDFTLGVAVLGASAAIPAFSQPNPTPDGRVAIIDTADDIRRLLAALKDDPRNHGIAVVARYYSRACQPQAWFAFKRLAFNTPGYVCGSNHWSGPPEHELLLAKGLAILSIYQQDSASPAKFVHGSADLQDRIRASRRPRDVAAPEVEAEADADAALKQATAVKQPEQTAIYFGVDFNVSIASSSEAAAGGVVRGAMEKNRIVDAVLAYFARLKSLLGDRVGAYGNGYINRVLREAGHIKYSWVSESRSFSETPHYLADTTSRHPWHLFQHQIDRRWFATSAGGKRCDAGVSLDMSVQNPNVASFGAWNASGAFDMAPARTAEIFRQRWVATREGIPVFVDRHSGRRVSLVACREQRWQTERHRSVRVLEDHGDWLRVDVNDDGLPEGFCQKKDPATAQDHFVDSIFKMPKWS